MDNLKYWIWLDTVFGNNGRIWEIMNFFESASEAYYELNFNSDVVELSQKEIYDMRGYNLLNIESLIDECHKKGVGIISYDSEKYPKQLRHISNPPAIIYYKGNIDCISSEKIITSVGARKPSDYSLYVTRNICHELAENGIVIASGFAKGIDITSHLESVKANMPTICVMGCGVDMNYPSDNFRYRDMILDSGGVFISEFPIGTKAFGANFPKRNRILSAIGQASVVFQASMASGSLITANFAAEQGREVFCMPPPDIFSADYSGNIYLLRNGALPFYCTDDILAYLDIENSVHSYKSEYTPEIYEIPENDYISFEKSEKSVKSEIINVSIPESSEDDEKYAQNCQKIIELLSENPLHVDVIAQKLNLNPTELMTALTELEIVGYIRSLPGKMFEMKR